MKHRWRIVSTLLLCSIFTVAQSSNPADAIALEQQGKLEQAAQVWRAVTKRDSANAGAFASLGVVLSKEQKYSEAASAYRSALKLNSKLAGVQLNLGLAEFKQGHFQTAIKPFGAVLAADPKNHQARTLLGLSYYGTKQFADATKHLALAAKADPSNAELQQTLAQSCLWAKQYLCALEQFRLVLQRDPNSVAAHILVGEALDGLQKTTEAIAEFQEAVKVAQQEPNVHFGLAYLYWEMHQYDDARREFENELALDPDHAQSIAYLGDIELKQEHPDKAVPLLKKAITLKGDIRIAYVDLATILTRQKHYDEALVPLRRAVELDPDQPDAHFRLGQIYKAKGNKAEADTEFAKVRDLHKKTNEDLVRKMSSAPPALGQEPAPSPN